MAVDMFLKIDGVTGESADAKRARLKSCRSPGEPASREITSKN